VRDPKNVQGKLAKLGGEIVRAAAVDLAGKALVYVGIFFLVALGLLIYQGGSVAAWLLLVPIALLILVAVLAARRLHAQSVDNDSLTKELSRSGEYSGLLQNSLDALQRVISGDVDIDIPNYLEQGVLEPARRILTEKPAENVRLSVLLPSPDAPDRWSMPWSAGHSVIGKAKYDQRIADTLARHAFESGEPQDWKDTSKQTEFRQNPQASAPTRSMVSIPIRVGDEILGVFDAVSSEKDAFDETELTFLASLAGVIAVAVSVWRSQTP
jgi:GAF domain-containing protein